VDIKVLDHIIVAGGETMSFAERGMIQEVPFPLPKSRAGGKGQRFLTISRLSRSWCTRVPVYA
jgi:hypothetical protein